MRLLFLAFLFLTIEGFGNDSLKLYNPKADVKADMEKVLTRAKAENKHVLIQVGGNWCVWCYRLDAFIKKDSAINKLVHDSYVVYHLNYSPENKNLAYLKKLGFPQRFGFPVLVVMDASGQRLHTQDSGLLEQGKSYHADKLKSFLTAWAPAAFNEKLYKD